MEKEEINSMKYSELQKLAKSVGIKANMKIDKLKTALIKHYGCNRKQSEKQSDHDENSPQVKKVAKNLKQDSLSSPRVVNVTPGKQTPSSIGRKAPMKSIVDKVKSQQRLSLTPHASPQRTQRVSASNKVTSASSTPKDGGKNSQTRKRKMASTEYQRSPKKAKRTPERGSVGEKEDQKTAIQSDAVAGTAEEITHQTSDDIQDVIGAMTSGMSQAEMKESLLQAIERKVLKKVQEEPSLKRTAIPRLTTFPAKKEAILSPSGKDWQKIHQKQFNKMDSLDVYLEKKRKRQEEMSSSAKKTKSILEETKAVISKIKNHKTPDIHLKRPARTSLKKTPKTESGGTAALSSQKTHPLKTPETAHAAKKVCIRQEGGKVAVSSQKTHPFKTPETSFSSKKVCVTEEKVFKPSVFSLQDATFAFDGATPSDRSFAKSKETPFKFNASMNKTLDGTKSGKKNFDLKSSLSRPVTWKMHKGKLKPFENPKPFLVGAENNNPNTSQRTTTDRKQSRAAVTKSRRDKKTSNMLSRRGLTAV